MNKTRVSILLGTVLIMAIASLPVAACSPQQNTSDNAASTDEVTGTAVAWSADADCGTCHQNQQASSNDSACEASLHADLACVSCHDEADALANAHAGKTSEDKTPKRLKQTDVADETCLACHYGTQADLIAATQDIAITDSKGTSRNPHDIADVAEHQDIACADCHNMHDSELLAERAKEQCLSCHHANVFECYTCHE